MLKSAYRNRDGVIEIVSVSIKRITNIGGGSWIPTSREDTGGGCLAPIEGCAPYINQESSKCRWVVFFMEKGHLLTNKQY